MRISTASKGTVTDVVIGAFDQPQFDEAGDIGMDFE